MADIARSAGAFGVFRVMLAAYRTTGLDAWLRGPGPVTALFVPDDAFGRGQTGPLLAAGPSSGELDWASFLTLHLVPGYWDAGCLSGETAVTCLDGRMIPVGRAGRLTLGGVAVIQANVRCDNGVIHVLETPLDLPRPWMGSPAPAEAATSDGP